MRTVEQTMNPTLRRIVSTLVQVATIALATPAMAAPVAMISQCQGDIAIGLASAPQPCETLAYLEDGTQVVLGASALIKLVYFAAASEKTVNGPTTFNVSSAPPAGGDSRDLSIVKDTGLVPSDRLAQASVVMRSMNATLKGLSPKSGRVLDPPSTLAWKPLKGAATYKVTIEDEVGDVVYRADIAEPPATVPDAPSRFKRGEYYEWRVETVVSQRQYRGRGNFELVDNTVRQRVSELETRTASDRTAALLYGVILEELELRQDARRWWATLRDRYPNDAGIKRRLRDLR